jgi:iron-sulfur cluster insertion protein
MSEVSLSAAPPVTLTAAAARRIAQIMQDEGKTDLKLRVTVSGGGCSGYQYGFSLDDVQTEEDMVLARDGVAVLIDSVSLDFLRGAEIDFVDELMGQSFRINNPNATSKCGCGSSFSV